MKVTLIDYTGRGLANPALYAAEMLIYAKSTRLTQGEELVKKIKAMTAEQVAAELDSIQMSVRSSWEFIHLTWQIEGVSRAFTHQMVRSRHFSFAQQAMRVAKMDDFNTLVPESVIAIDNGLQWEICMSVIRHTYKHYRDQGAPAQDARGVLPTNVLTNIVVGANLRAFAETVGKRDNPRAQDEYVEVIHAMAARLLEVYPWAEAFLWPERKRTPNLDKIMREQLNGRSPVDLPEVNAALKEIDQLKAAWG